MKALKQILARGLGAVGLERVARSVWRRARCVGSSRIKPLMSRRELALYRRLIRDRSAIVEFGCGGSTLQTLRYSKAILYSVDSDRDWIERLLKRGQIRRAVRSGRLQFHHADLGPVGEWGYPVFPPTSEQAARYHSVIWVKVEGATIDLVLIDGRFRVACAIEALRHCPKAAIVIHDFWDRPQYHSLLQALSCLDRADTMGVFSRRLVSPELLDRLFREAELDVR